MRIFVALEPKSRTTERVYPRDVITHLVVCDRLKDDPATGCGVPTEGMICTPFLGPSEIDCPECQVVFVSRTLRESETD
jgi:hypothetical protein